MTVAAAILRGLTLATIVVSTACQSATGIVATYRKNGDTIVTVEVGEQGYGRIEQRVAGDTGPIRSYSLVAPGGRTTTVIRRAAVLGAAAADNGWLVMDSLDHSEWLHRSYRPTPSVEEQGPFREAGEARIGQWTGTRYVLTVRPFSWVEVKELVVLRDPDLAPLGRLLGENSLNAWKAYGITKLPDYQREMARLMAEGAPLKAGDNFTLVSLERKRVDPARLRPPSPPLTRAELFRLLDSRPVSPPRPPVASDRFRQ